MIDTEKRKALIEAQVKKAAASVKGEAILEPALLAEVANLVEKPTAVLGGFDSEFLQLPREVLISVMRKHQRYFPLEKNGKLLPNFVAIRNGDEEYLDLVRQGNEHVLGARFADANFFVREDLKHPLEHYRPELSGLIFQTKLGSMLDKSERIEKLVEGLIPMLGLEKDEAVFARRAAHLAKADLVTQMCVEMTSLQGIIGREYALRSGENLVVAEAIGQQYQAVPQGKPGLAVALADRIDSLVGLFAAGLVPTGAKDPFALRRAAIGVVEPLMQHDLSFDLHQAVAQAAKLQPIEVGDQVQAQVLEFINGRLNVLLKDAGHRYDVVEAVLAVQSHDPASAARAVKQMETWVGREDWSTILPAYARCVRITRDQPEMYPVKPGSFAEQAEHDLYTALLQAESSSRATGSVDDFLNAFLPLIPAVNKFFDDVLVMDEDLALQHNRLGLVQRVAALADRAADLSKLEGF